MDRGVRSIKLIANLISGAYPDWSFHPPGPVISGALGGPHLATSHGIISSARCLFCKVGHWDIYGIWDPQSTCAYHSRGWFPYLMYLFSLLYPTHYLLLFVMLMCFYARFYEFPLSTLQDLFLSMARECSFLRSKIPAFPWKSNISVLLFPSNSIDQNNSFIVMYCKFNNDDNIEIHDALFLHIVMFIWVMILFCVTIVLIHGLINVIVFQTKIIMDIEFLCYVFGKIKHKNF